MSFSLDDRQIVVNYHYVEDPTTRNSGAHPCPLTEFDRQIGFLSNYFRFTSVPEVFAAAQNHRAERLCAITFDDGLKGQYLYAVPILRKNKAPATFFIITATFAGFVPVPHKTHILFSFYSSERLVDLANEFFGKKYFIPKDRRLTDKRPWDDIFTANLKETLLILPDYVRNQFLDRLLKNLNYDKRELSGKIFMNEDKVSRLFKEGFYIGSHTHRHESLDTLRQREIEDTIKKSKKCLEDLLGVAPSIFCYPSGRFNGEAVRVVKEQKFTHAVTIVQSPVRPGNDPLLIPRYDTNDIRDFLNRN